MNRFAVSNIAWPQERDDHALALLASLGFDGIELAPVKVAGSWDAATPSFFERYRRIVESQELGVCALQGIFFATEGMSLFGSEDSRTAMRAHVVKVAEIARAAGASAIVYGAPRTRDSTGKSKVESTQLAVDWLQSVGDSIAHTGVTFCFEANVPGFGCNFITSTPQAVELIAAVDHPSIRIQFDTGTAFSNHEPADSLARALSWAGHFHVSEPDLDPVGSTGADHKVIQSALDKGRWSGWISIEMRETSQWQLAVKEASNVLRAYGLSSPSP